MDLQRGRIVGFAMGTAAWAFAMTAHASLVLTCHLMPEEDCSGSQDCQPQMEGELGPGNLVMCNAPTVTCTPENSQSICQYQEEVWTPNTVYRSFNGTNHAYGTSLVPRAGYTLEGEVFTLANDSYGGAVQFPMIDGATLYDYPPDDSSALSADPNLIPIYRYYNPTYADYFFTTDQSEVSQFPCTPPGCGFWMNGSCLAPTPPNCYYLMEPVYGYGGP